MTPTEIKAKVQDTHRRAMSNASLQMSRDGGVHHLFRDVKLYGRDAGVDFVETNIGQIVQEAVLMAECKRPSLEIPAYGFGKAAVAGMAQALEDLTALKIEVKGNTLQLIWAQPNPGYV